jgi:[NiFe] hydrogenase assembly HybE family chaperone
MNLTVLPGEADRSLWVGGESVRLAFPSGQYDLQVSALEDVGLIATCSLFSPMSEFTDHEAAQVAAQAAADGLFEPEEAPDAPVLSRRDLLGGGAKSGA